MAFSPFNMLYIFKDAVVCQRNPFASMNIYYDERWIEKQEVAFTAWLNFILTPNDDFSSEDVKGLLYTVSSLT